jgi:SAM-dependent methyltransferase
MGFLSGYLKSRLVGHLDYDSWRPEEKRKYLKYFPKNVTTVLDVGCGRGELLWLLKNKGFKVEGCDTDAVCIRKARSIIEEVKYADIEKLSECYTNDSFDLLTCLHVLEHCHSPYAALKELKIVTRRYILVAVPNARYIAHEERDTHLYSWNEKTFKNILENTGLKILLFSRDWVNIFPNLLRMTPILNVILLRIFFGPMELIALVEK